MNLVHLNVHRDAQRNYKSHSTNRLCTYTYLNIAKSPISPTPKSQGDTPKHSRNHLKSPWNSLEIPKYTLQKKQKPKVNKPQTFNFPKPLPVCCLGKTPISPAMQSELRIACIRSWQRLVDEPWSKRVGGWTATNPSHFGVNKIVPLIHIWSDMIFRCALIISLCIPKKILVISISIVILGTQYF